MSAQRAVSCSRPETQQPIMSLSAQRCFFFFSFDARLSPLRLPARSLFIETRPNMEKRTAAPRVLPARRTSASLLSERRLWCRALAIIAPTGNVGLGYDYQNGGSFFFSAAASTHLLSAARPPLSPARRVEFKHTWLQTFRSVTLFNFFKYRVDRQPHLPAGQTASQLVAHLQGRAERTIILPNLLNDPRKDHPPT